VTYNAIPNFRGRFDLDRQISFNAVGLTKKKRVYSKYRSLSAKEGAYNVHTLNRYEYSVAVQQSLDFEHVTTLRL